MCHKELDFAIADVSPIFSNSYATSKKTYKHKNPNSRVKSITSSSINIANGRIVLACYDRSLDSDFRIDLRTTDFAKFLKTAYK